MTITLPPALAVFVGYAVRAGHYPSELEVLHQALRLLSERDMRALIKEGVDSADRGELRDAQTVFAEIRAKLVAAAQQEATPPQPLSNVAIYNWLADGLDALDMGQAEYARETLAGLRDRLHDIVAEKREDQSRATSPRVSVDGMGEVGLSDIEPSRPQAGSPQSDFSIDWTKEPATERERRIRAAILSKGDRWSARVRASGDGQSALRKYNEMLSSGGSRIRFSRSLRNSPGTLRQLCRRSKSKEAGGGDPRGRRRRSGSALLRPPK